MSDVPMSDARAASIVYGNGAASKAAVQPVADKPIDPPQPVKAEAPLSPARAGAAMWPELAKKDDAPKPIVHRTKASLTDAEKVYGAEGSLTAESAGDGDEPSSAPGDQEAAAIKEPAEFVQLTTDVQVALPADTVVDLASAEQFGAIVAKAGVDQKVAQELVNLHAQSLTQVVEDVFSHQETFHDDLKRHWAEQAKADPEFGGRNFANTIAAAKRTLKTFGDDELRGELSAWGFSNNPAFIRLLARFDRYVTSIKSRGY